jgi:deoxycytidylate deaminase
MIINAKLSKVIYESSYPDKHGVNFLREAGVVVENLVTDKLKP